MTTTEVDGSIKISVEDTGCGISEARQRLVFDPFFTTKPRSEGTGLGLSLSAEIIRSHGGEIRLTSRVGEGSRFDVILPEGDLEQVESRRPTSSPAPAARKRLRILVIDDEPMICGSLARMLGKDHEVVTAAGGGDALALLEGDAAFDVILCDLMMPQVDGPQVYDVLSERSSALAERMVFMSGGAFSSRSKDFVTATRALVLDKPFTKDKILGILHAIGHRAPRAAG